MADFSVIKKNYKKAIKKLLPPGFAWNSDEGDELDLLLSALSGEPARIDQRGIDYLKELDPNQTFELLDVWERLLGIPDECTSENSLNIQDRRTRIIQKLTTGGGQSPAFYLLLAERLGFDAEIFSIENYYEFRAGHSRAGDGLWNASGGWPYAFKVVAPADTLRYFRAGQSTAGERLVFASNDVLECVIRKYKPAHTSVVFSFTE